MNLNLFAISELLIIATFAPTAFYIFPKKGLLTKIFALFLFSVSLWGLGGFILMFVSNADLALIIFKFAAAAVFLIPAFFYHSILLLTKKRNYILLTFFYIQAVIFFILTLGGYLIISTRYVFNSFYWGIAAYPLYHLAFIVWLVIAILTHTELITYYKKCYPKEKGQIQLLMWVIIGYLGGTQNFFLTMGYDLYPYGNLLVPIVGLVIAYAIFKHQLLDITIPLKRSLIYSILIASISITYLLTVFILEKYAQQLLGYRSLLLSFITAFTLGLIFVPLRHRIQQFVDRYFFKGTQEEIVLQNEQLRKEITQAEKHKAVAALASGIAHEVRNPLTAIKTFYEHFPQKKDDPEFLAKFTNITGKEIGRIEGLIQQLLDFAKPSPPSFRDTDINRLIEDTLELISSKINKSNIQLTKNLSPINPDAPSSMSVGTPTEALAERRSHHLKVDPNQIKQVLLNIFLNAIDAMPSGGKLTVRTTNDERRFTISIADTGCGIAPEDLKHIFDPFFSKKATGTGLGLAITQSIIEEHKGIIKVNSMIGEGTIFIIELPC